MLAPSLVTSPSATPVSLAEAKLHLRVVGSGEDPLITALIQAATQHLDGWTGVLGRALVTQTWRQDFEGFCTKLRLPLGPVASITSISYFDDGNLTQTLPDTAYTLLTDALGPYVTLKPDQSWPSSYGRADAVAVTYEAGVAAANVPAPLKAAILLMVGNLFENREATVVGTISGDLPNGVDILISPYRKVM